MKKFALLVILSGFFNCLQAQFTLRIMVDKVATKTADDIYVSGSFNNWDPNNAKYKLKPFGTSRRGIVLNDLPLGKVQFKITRGSWDKVEVTADGKEIENREADINADLTQTIQVAGWKDNYPDKPKPNTASPQVSLLDTAFYMPQLQRSRRIWIYLPKSYATSHKNYPVIYMNDGQNLFNEQTASFGEWGVDETLDSLQAKKGIESIVIGIDNGGDKRLTEYNPYDNAKYGKAEGRQYVAFIAETLKPYIDKKFRTVADRAHTFIAGSSMGGLISMYAVIAYPKVFGGAGVFSPSFALAPAIYDDAVKASFTGVMPVFYFYAGGQEGGLMVPDLDKMVNVIQTKGAYQTRRIMAPLGKHNEATWRREFPGFVTFILP